MPHLHMQQQPQGWMESPLFPMVHVQLIFEQYARVPEQLWEYSWNSAALSVLVGCSGVALGCAGASC